MNNYLLLFIIAMIVLLLICKINVFNNNTARYANITKQISPGALKNLTAFTDNVVSITGNSTAGDTMDVYILQVPKGTPQADINVNTIVPKKVRVELFLWSAGT